MGWFIFAIVMAVLYCVCLNEESAQKAKIRSQNGFETVEEMQKYYYDNQITAEKLTAEIPKMIEEELADKGFNPRVNSYRSKLLGTHAQARESWKMYPELFYKANPNDWQDYQTYGKGGMYSINKETNHNPNYKGESLFKYSLDNFNELSGGYCYDMELGDNLTSKIEEINATPPEQFGWKPYCDDRHGFYYDKLTTAISNHIGWCIQHQYQRQAFRKKCLKLERDRQEINLNKLMWE